MVRNRYRVLAVWGRVPEQIREIVGKEGAFLLYPEFRGVDSHQELFDDREGIIGGWSMQYAGKKP